MRKFRKSFFIIIFLFLLVGGCCFVYIQAQYVSRLPVGRLDISDPLNDILSLLQRIKPLITSSHAAAEDAVMTLPHATIVRYLDESKDAYQFYAKIRRAFVQTLIDRQYPYFVTQPYQENGSIIVQSGDFKLLNPITQQDSLDQLLMPKLSLFLDDFLQIKKLKKHIHFNPITITSEEYDALHDVFLFKTEQDLRDLGYQLVSWKTRINTDPAYRRHNIHSAFNNMGNVRLLMPGEVFSTLRALRYIPGISQYSYVDGLVTVGNGAMMMYGGGLCGVATALYQGSLTNLGLALLEYRPYSIYYRNLYEAEINGITIKEPGLDATIFSPVFDLKLQNIRDYPIIIGFSFDGLSGSQEQVFTLAKHQDKGTFQYVRTYKKGGSTCFTRKINGQERTNCYTKIKNF